MSRKKDASTTGLMNNRGGGWWTFGMSEGFFPSEPEEMDIVLSNNKGESHNGVSPASKSMSVVKSIIHLL